MVSQLPGRHLDEDVHDIGLHTAWRRAQNRSDCRTLVRTAALQYGHAIDDDDDVLQGARVEV